MKETMSELQRKAHSPSSRTSSRNQYFGEQQFGSNFFMSSEWSCIHDGAVFQLFHKTPQDNLLEIDIHTVI